MNKPRISKMTLFIMGKEWSCWRCLSEKGSGYGDTPAEAFDSYCSVVSPRKYMMHKISRSVRTFSMGGDK